jgi:hypothetical protein
MKSKIAFLLMGLASPVIIPLLLLAFLALELYIIVKRIIWKLEDDCQPYHDYQMD